MLLIAEYYVNKYNQNSSYFNYVLSQLLRELSWIKTRQNLSQFLHMHSSFTVNILNTSEKVKTQPDKVIFEVFP